MRRFLTALVTTGIIATAALVTASTADAQWGWRGNWRVGGDYYYPSDYSYGSAPLYNYGSLPTYGSVATVQPMQTIETIETVRTIRPAARSAHREIVTRQTTVRGFAANTYSQPLYSYAGSAAIVSAPAYGQTSNYDYGTSYTRPLYNAVATPAITTAAAPVITAPVITAPAYRYVYEWDRILVVDPSTNIVVQALPR
jgi:hypothetical protein